MLLSFLLVSFLKLVISEDELIFANVVIEFIYYLYQSCGANELILIFLTICGLLRLQLFRHGNRAPLRTFSSDPYSTSWLGEEGELTNVGSSIAVFRV